MKDIDFLLPADSLQRTQEVASMSGFVDDSGRIPFFDSDLYRFIKTEGTNYRILDLIVPKNLETVAWQ